MTENAQQWGVLTESHQILSSAVAGVPSNGWELPTPCSEWNVTQVLQHASLDQLLYVSSITGVAKPDGDAFHPSGELSESPLSYVDDAIRASRDAFASVSARAEAVPVPLPPFTVPAWLAAGAAALDAAVHGWDIAVATGQTAQLSPSLAKELLKVAENLVEPLRAWGAYAPAIEPPADADDAARLLYFLGRNPNWTPSQA
ncbi:MAG TPA: TIGR03086 family protein [Micromonosporaceae bacterium]|nr:TIGR03086 family protein [Micromonosporaceae bacterium]HCU49427.1 TIGR03086 family protein [Micromonosporaceae bacterium]